MMTYPETRVLAWGKAANMEEGANLKSKWLVLVSLSYS